MGEAGWVGGAINERANELYPIRFPNCLQIMKKEGSAAGDETILLNLWSFKNNDQKKHVPDTTDAKALPIETPILG